MLAEPLLRVRTRKDGTIAPLFCTTDQEVELAGRIISEFQTAWENKEKKSELDSRIEAIITATTESQQQQQHHHNSAVAAASTDRVKLVRGFCALLERRCIFKAAGTTTPVGSGSSRNDSNNNSGNRDDDDDVNASRESGLSSSPRSDPPSSPHPPYSGGFPLIVISGNPAKIRKAVFEESARRGFALTENEKREIVSAAAQTLELQQQVSVDDILEAMWSDLDDNLILDQFDVASIDAKTLVGWYNLSLMQTLLFRSTKLDFFVSGGLNWKNILRQVKRLGLMYYLHHRAGSLQQVNDNDNNDRIICSLEGPPSLFKLTDRYGTSLAKLLPSIVFSKGAWQIEAWILRKTLSGEKRIYNFKMTENDVPSLLADPVSYYHPHSQRDVKEKGGRMDPSSSSSPSLPHNYFDSIVEEKFARKFLDLSAGLGWELVREPDPLIVSGGRAFIPDFLFVKPGRKKVYLEIVGFWTPDYLERKFQKLAEIYDSAYATKLDDHMQGEEDEEGESSTTNKESKKKNKGGGKGAIELLTALNEDLACSEGSVSLSFSQLQQTIPSGRLILYKKDNVPAGPVIDCLKTIDKEAVEKAVNDPRIKIKLDHAKKDIIAIRDIAREIGKASNHDNDNDDDGGDVTLPLEAILRIVHRDNEGQYIDVAGTHLISIPKASRLKAMLADTKRFADACAILSQEGVPESCQAELVSKLGYDVQWQSLDPSSAVLVKRESNESSV